MIKCLIALTTFLPAAALAATVWTWVDEQGRRHYSDREVPGATAIEVGEAQTFSGSALRAGSPRTGASAAATDAAPVSYTTLEVISPAPEATLRNIEGMLTVEVATVPALAGPHRIDIILDGERQQINAHALELTVPEVWRGTHTLSAVILGEDGDILMQSEAISFYVHQTSVLN